jgi:hypothetical protein
MKMQIGMNPHAEKNIAILYVLLKSTLRKTAHSFDGLISTETRGSSDMRRRMAAEMSIR